MRILHVFDHSLPLHSGYSFRSRAILGRQRAMGWETVQVTSAKQGVTSDDIESVDGLSFHRTQPSRSVFGRVPISGQLSIIRSLSRNLERLVQRHRPDIVHAHSPCLTGLAALGVCRRQDTPLVYECRAFWEDAAVDHGTTRARSLRYRLTQRMENHVFQRCDFVTTICGGLQKEIVARGIPPAKVAVIPNAVDIEQFDRVAPEIRTSFRERLGVQNRFVIGFIGSFYAYEGLDLLVDAMDAIRKQIPDALLLLVGGGPEERSLRDQSGRFGSSVVFAGQVPHSIVSELYAAMDLLAYPRRSIRLTELVTPLKPLEALAFCRPVIASNIAGHRELLADGETALLFKHDDSDAIAQAVVAVYDDPSAAAHRTKTGRSFVAAERTWKHSVSLYQPIYEGLIRSRGSHR